MNNKKIGQLLFSLTNKLRRVINKRLQEFGVSGVQSRTLNYLYRKKDEDVYQTDIQEFLAIRGSSVTELITGLIDLGLVERKVSKSDKRKKKLSLTKKGEEVSLKTINTFEEIENDLKKDISEDVYDQLMVLLISIEEILDLKENETDV